MSLVASGLRTIINMRAIAAGLAVMVGVVVVCVVVVIQMPRQCTIGMTAMAMVMLVDHDGGRLGMQHAAAECFGEQGRGQHIVGRPVRQNAASQQNHPIGTSCLTEMVGGEHHRSTSSCLVGDHLKDDLLARKIQPRNWFVKEHKVGLRRDGSGNHDPLTLTTGELTEPTCTQRIDIEPTGGGIDRRAIIAMKSVEHPAISPHPQHLVYRQRHPRVVVLVLRDKRYPWCTSDRTIGWRQQAAHEV